MDPQFNYNFFGGEGGGDARHPRPTLDPPLTHYCGIVMGLLDETIATLGGVVMEGSNISHIVAPHIPYPIEPCAGQQILAATAPPRSEEARTSTTQSFNARARTAPHRNLLYLGPRPHHTMENVGPHQGPQ